MKTLTRDSFRFLFILILSAFVVQGQDPQPESTTLPTDARFEIVMSPLAAKWTFRLDRYTGNVSQLVVATEGGNGWRAMYVAGSRGGSSEGPARYILVTSGLTTRDTFLMDTTTGRTWTLTTFTDGDVGWAPVVY